MASIRGCGHTHRARLSKPCSTVTEMSWPPARSSGGPSSSSPFFLRPFGFGERTSRKAESSGRRTPNLLLFFSIIQRFKTRAPLSRGMSCGGLRIGRFFGGDFVLRIGSFQRKSPMAMSYICKSRGSINPANVRQSEGRVLMDPHVPMRSKPAARRGWRKTIRGNCRNCDNCDSCLHSAAP